MRMSARYMLLVYCLSQVIFLFLLFLGMVRYATSSETQGQLVGLIKNVRGDLTVNFHHEHFIDPTNCSWVSEDVYANEVETKEIKIT